MQGIARWAAVHRKLLVFITGTALTLAIQIWGTNNPYVSLAVLAATGLGVYQAPNKSTAPAQPARVPEAGPPPSQGPGVTAPVASAGLTGIPPDPAPGSAAGAAGAGVAGFPPSAFPAA